MSTTITQLNHTRERLKKVFEKVQNKEHWKNPIDAVIHKSEMDVTDEAIRFFTGTPAYFSSTSLSLAQCEAGMVRVLADGYYLGPCN